MTAISMTAEEFQISGQIESGFDKVADTFQQSFAQDEELGAGIRCLPGWRIDCLITGWLGRPEKGKALDGKNDRSCVLDNERRRGARPRASA